MARKPWFRRELNYSNGPASAVRHIAPGSLEPMEPPKQKPATGPRKDRMVPVTIWGRRLPEYREPSPTLRKEADRFLKRHGKEPVAITPDHAPAAKSRAARIAARQRKLEQIRRSRLRADHRIHLQGDR